MAEDSTEHVQVRALEHFEGTSERPALRYAIEMRDRPGPAYKAGVYSDDVVWVQLRGGLFVATARIDIAWKGEYSGIDEIRRRARGWTIPEPFWEGRPRAGYAIVAELADEQWIEPFWAGPRTYAYEWIVLENDGKRASWLEPKDPPRTGDRLKADFVNARIAGFAR